MNPENVGRQLWKGTLPHCRLLAEKFPKLEPSDSQCRTDNQVHWCIGTPL